MHWHLVGVSWGRPVFCNAWGSSAQQGIVPSQMPVPFEKHWWVSVGWDHNWNSFLNWKLFCSFKYIIQHKIFFAINSLLEKKITNINDLLEQFGLLKMDIYSLSSSSCCNSRRGVFAVSTASLAGEESALGLIYYVSWLYEFFSLKHLFTPWSTTFKENFKVFVHLFSWSLCHYIVTYLFWPQYLENILQLRSFSSVHQSFRYKILFYRPCAKKEVWVVGLEWDTRFRRKRRGVQSVKPKVKFQF